ncbi:hypothetical protein O181_004030 [Austropuccinia psidii MF-1]|uniref:Uncharacterized protein n=1 Tax=Austropuccinia psidii MF-1 TaxID=1389203 RepID=A0A9Q3BFK4_9BASI|nr:hypothetical protein [Austropuccinia psidii MF-1]
MKSILNIKRLYNLLEGTEKAAFSLEQHIIDPTRKELAFETICINFNVKIASKFSTEANDDPEKLWKRIDSFYQPKPIQNQTSYLNGIFSSHSPKAKLEDVLSRILEQTQNLCSLIDDKLVKLSALLNSVVAMSVIINLPPECKTEGELWLKKCDIEKNK